MKTEELDWFALNDVISPIKLCENVMLLAKCKLTSIVYAKKGKTNLVKVFNKIVLMEERSFLFVYAGYSKWSYVCHTSNTPFKSNQACTSSILDI